MNKIEQLKNEIIEIENNIDREASKEELYDVLVRAYYKAKDIIELYDNIELVIDTETSKLRDSLDVCLNEKETLTDQLEAVKQELIYTENKLEMIRHILDDK